MRRAKRMKAWTAKVILDRLGRQACLIGMRHMDGPTYYDCIEPDNAPHRLATVRVTELTATGRKGKKR